MYIPKYFKVTDFNEITEFVSENSFGTIVTTNNGKPIATHIPLEFSKEGEDYFITTIWHMEILNGELLIHAKRHL